MNIKITLENQDHREFCLPYHYEEYIQAFLYRLNEPEFGDFLHNIGYSYQNRVFRLFSFSRILERPQKILTEKHMFVFSPEISFFVSTVENPMLEALIETIYQEKRTYYIGNYPVTITEVEFIVPPVSSDIVVRSLSPVCIYSTAVLPNGKKRTIYYEPEEKEFSELIRQNAVKKYCAFHQHEPEDTELKVIPCGKMKEVKSSYKGFLIKGYLGRFRLIGSQELIQMMLEAGMGGKNAEGKGMIVPEKLATIE